MLACVDYSPTVPGTEQKAGEDQPKDILIIFCSVGFHQSKQYNPMSWVRGLWHTLMKTFRGVHQKVS